jgi:hypothetical protein
MIPIGKLCLCLELYWFLACGIAIYFHSDTSTDVYSLTSLSEGHSDRQTEHAAVYTMVYTFTGFLLSDSLHSLDNSVDVGMSW